MQSAGVGNGEAYARTQVSSTWSVCSKPIRFITERTVADRLVIVGAKASLYTHWNQG